MSNTKKVPTVPEHQAYLALQSSALRLKDEVEHLLKQSGLTVTQFNVLRILRGAQEEALTCSEIASRLLNKDPDVTRLLDRMEKQALIERHRDHKDRRVLLTRLSPEGRRVVDLLDAPMMDLHRQQFGHMPAERVELLVTLLREVAGQG
ncbi:MarR family transcriptional regulator [Deinococcus piscis]|uniref:MarR family transcriptional regulator n=1 Tax=Deinococcus piscis TaxID=394230 RepID=A0ABQ3K2K0_9DEIO|nr:MarR family transcriptional regulator [Deinococcus piscis]GHG01135.1 MarR family transcriptional regulator [Deinococcus piscis]